VLEGHALAVELMPDEATAATEYAPDEVVSASERLERERLGPKSLERLDPKRSEPKGLGPLSTAAGLEPLRRYMRMKTQKSHGSALMAGRPGQSATQETAQVAHAGRSAAHEAVPVAHVTAGGGSGKSKVCT